MKQAKVLTDTEMKRLLIIIAGNRHAARNRLALKFSHLAGLRVGEIAALKVGEVINGDGQVLDQIRLDAAITKGNVARTVFINQSLQQEIEVYLSTFPTPPLPSSPLLKTQKNTSFSANTMCQLFSKLYQDSGIVGASSHSGRRGYISKMAHALVSPKVIMELVGHKHLTTTQRYIEVDDNMKRAAVEKI